MLYCFCISLRRNAEKKSKDPFVKCPKDGELPSERKVLELAVWVLHPASQNKRKAFAFFIALETRIKEVFLYGKRKLFHSCQEGFFLF